MAIILMSLPSNAFNFADMHEDKITIRTYGFYLSWDDAPLVEDSSVRLDAEDTGLGDSELVLLDLVVDVGLLLGVSDDDVEETLLGQVVAQRVGDVGEALQEGTV